MKLSGLLLPALLCAASASAQYFSAGWMPGQAASSAAAPPPSAAPMPSGAYNFDPSPKSPQQAAAGESLESQMPQPGMVEKVLLSTPVTGLFGKFGVNLTEVLARGAVPLWDARVPLITDENYEEMIVNERMTDEEAKDRVWFLIITVSTSTNNAISRFVDKSFDEAYNMTLLENDLPNVRWGRIDYMSVTYLTTKWSIWSGPWLVVLTDRGEKLRFYKATGIRLTPEMMRELLTEEIWRESHVWDSMFAPGGNWERAMHYYAYGLMKFFNAINRIPKFLLMILSGSVASLVIRLLHKSPPEGAAPAPVPTQPAPVSDAKSQTGTVASKSDAATSTTTATSSPSKKAKQRKAGKK